MSLHQLLEHIAVKAPPLLEKDDFDTESKRNLEVSAPLKQMQTLWKTSRSRG
jgi:hypothetical protein